MWWRYWAGTHAKKTSTGLSLHRGSNQPHLSNQALCVLYLLYESQVEPYAWWNTPRPVTRQWYLRRFCQQFHHIILANFFPTKHCGNVACWMPLVGQHNLKDDRKLAFCEATLYTFLFFWVVCLLSIRGIKLLVPCVDGRSAPTAVQLNSMRRLLRCSSDGVHVWAELVFPNVLANVLFYCYHFEKAFDRVCLCCQLWGTIRGSWAAKFTIIS